MVAVFTGNGLGLFDTSLSQIGLGLGGRSALGQSREDQYVNVATGNLVLHAQDEQLFGQGVGTALTRTYNSLGQVGGQIGEDVWLTGFERRVDLTVGKLGKSGSEMTLWTGDGESVVFHFAGRVDGQWQYDSTAGDGAHDVLRWDERAATWTLVEGSTRREQVFADHRSKNHLNGRLEIIRDGRTGAEFNVLYGPRNGNVHPVSEVRAANGDALVFDYDRHGRLAQISTREGGVLKGQVSYGYDDSGRLSQVTTDLTPEDSADSAVFWTRYTYVDDSRMRIATVEQSDGLVTSYTYYDDGRIHAVTLGDTNLDDGDGAGQTQTFVYRDGATDVTDSAGRTWTYEFDEAGQLVRVLSPAVDGQRLVSRYGYDRDGNLLWSRDADGLTTSMEYDERGNRVRQVNGDGDVVTRTYSTSNQLLTEAVHLAGNEALVTRYVYDSEDRLRYAVSALGEVTEHVHAPTASGETRLSHSRIHLGARYDLSGFDPDQAPSRRDLDRWAAAQDLADTTRVDFTYDLRGQLAERRSWASVDAQGRGVLDAAAEIVRYSYDAQGLLRQQIVLRGEQREQGDISSWSYDGMGRLLGSVDALGHATVRTYDDAGQRMLVKLANGLVRIHVRDRAGQTVAITESAAGLAQTRTTAFSYNAQGQLRATQDASGDRHYRFYDAAGRLVGTVDSTGAAVAFRHNGAGQVVQTTAYAALVDTRAWWVDSKVVPTELDAVLPPASADDRTVFASYDDAGRLATEVDAAGTTTTYHYDDASRLLRTEVRGSTGEDAPRVTRYFYDDAGRRVATLDAEGYLVEWRFDPAGRAIESIRYATATPANRRPDGELAELRPAASDGDIRTRNFYNGRDQKVAVLDAEGYLTEFVFDEAGNTRAQLRYTNELSLAAGDSLASLRARAGATRETRSSFDALGRRVLERNAEGTVTRYHYDEMGHLVRTEAAHGTSELREKNARYDVFGNLIGELDGEGSLRLLDGMDEAQLDAIYAQYGVRHMYDALDRRIESIDADGNRTWYFHDSAGRMTHTVRGVEDAAGVRNAAGEVSETRYNAFGDAVETIAYTGRIAIAAPFEREQVASAIAVLQYVAERDSRVVSTYDHRGLLATRIDAEGYLTRYAYTAFGQLDSQARAVDASGRQIVTDYAYDRLGRLLHTTEDVGGLERRLEQSWDAFGRRVTATDGRHTVMHYQYDRLGRQVVQSRIVSGRLEQTETAYDVWSRVLSRTDALGHTTTYAYDDATRSVTMTTPEQVVLRTEHNRHGQTVRVLDGAGVETSYRYDDDGRLLETTVGNLPAASREYDERGLLVRTVDATGRTIEYRYDAAGRTLARTVDPDGLALTTAYRYDGQGRQLSVTDPAGTATKMEYDLNGRLLATVRDAAGLALRTEYSWDGLGRQLSVTEGAGTDDARIVSYVYDDLGRRISETIDPDGLELTTTYRYDGNDNLVFKRDAAGRVTRYVYDEADRLSLTVDGAGGVNRSTYDAAGRLVASRRYAAAISLDGLPEAASAAQIEARLRTNEVRDIQQYRVHDADGRLRYTVDGAGGVTAMDYDGGDRVVQTRRHADALALTVSLRQQLWAGAVDADALAARVSVDAAHDQVSSRVYDSAGRLRFSVDALGGVTETRVDAEGRLIESRSYAQRIELTPARLAQLRGGQLDEAGMAALVAGLGAGGRAQSFVYDAAGRRTHRITRARIGTADEIVGVVNESVYDAADRVTREIAYGVALPGYAVFADATAVRTALQSAGAEQRTGQRITEHRYDGAGRLRFTFDNAGAVTEQRFDAVGQVVQSRQYGVLLTTVPATEGELATVLADASDVRATHYFYDDAGRLEQTRDALDNSEYFTYDGAGLRESYTNRDGHTWNYTYDGAGRQLAETSPRLTVAGFDADGNVITNSRHITTRLRYDGLGNVIARTEDADGSGRERTTEYVYDNRGHQIRTIFPDAGVWNAGRGMVVATGRRVSTEVHYDALGRAVMQKDVRGHYGYRIYDAAGQLHYEIDQEGYVTGYRYNAFGEQIALTRYAQAIDVAAGRPLSAEDVQAKLRTNATSDRTLSTSYDLRGQKVQVQQDAVRYYDSRGGSGIARPTTRFVYDAYGQLVRESVLLEGQPDAADARWAHTTHYYDLLGRQNLTVDAEGYVTELRHNAHGEVLERIEYARALRGTIDPARRPGPPPAGDAVTGFDRTTTFTYDALGRKDSETVRRHAHNHDGVVRARDVVTKIEYDNEGHATRTIVDGTATETAYDALGRAVSVKEAERNVLHGDADALLGRSAGNGLEDAALYERVSPYSTMAYDAFGNVIQVRRYANGWRDGQAAPRSSGSDQLHTTRYDWQGRSVWERDAAGTVHTRRYDAADNLLETRYTLGGNISVVIQEQLAGADRPFRVRRLRPEGQGVRAAGRQRRPAGCTLGPYLAVLRRAGPEHGHRGCARLRHRDPLHRHRRGPRNDRVRARHRYRRSHGRCATCTTCARRRRPRP